MEARALGAPAWPREALLASPAHASVAAWIERLPADRFPRIEDLDALVEGRDDVLAGSGAPIRFVDPGRLESPAYYELEIDATGSVPTRPDNWHDLFNALAWASFPLAKRQLNREHVAEIARRGGDRRVRGPVRDALSLFDEGGIVVACADPSLAALLGDFQWKPLFWMRRADVAASMRFFLFGHAVMEKAIAPYVGLTAKALVLPVAAACFDEPMAVQLARLDAAIAAFFAESGASLAPRRLQPLPILGIPGWTPANADASYYDDVRQFRPGRRAAA